MEPKTTPHLDELPTERYALDVGTNIEHDASVDGFLPLAVPSRRPDVTISVCRGVIRLLASMDHAAITEMTLANGRRADVVGVGPKGEITIVEVKSSVEDFRVDLKWPEYEPFCDAFYFAVGPGFPQEVLPIGPGLIVADAYGGAIIRRAPHSPLVPARRKALTLQFARLAANRSARLVG